VQVYELTAWGYEAEEAIKVLGRWAARSPDHDPSLPLSAASLMLSFRTMLSADRLGMGQAVIGFTLGDETFGATLADGRIEIARGLPDAAVVSFSGAPMGVAAIVYGGVPIAEAERQPLVKIEGSRAVAAWFATLFPLPAKAGSA